MARLDHNPGTLTGRLLGASVCVLLAALLLWCAVQLIEAVLVPLLILAGVAGAGVVAWLRIRRW